MMQKHAPTIQTAAMECLSACSSETGIPALIINGDLNDLRLISDEQTKTNVEAFIEQLEESKA